MQDLLVVLAGIVVYAVGLVFLLDALVGRKVRITKLDDASQG